MHKVVLAVCLIATCVAHAGERDLPQYPAAFSQWQQLINNINFGSPADYGDWAQSWIGVGGHRADGITISGQPIMHSSICKPHDCGANYAEVLFSANSVRVVGLVQVQVDPKFPPIRHWVGDIRPQEFICLLQLSDPSIKAYACH
jgi:hypothetical protein